MFVNPFQGLVDLSQRKPSWWCLHCAHLMMMSAVITVALVFSGTPSLLFVFGFINGYAAWVFIRISKNEADLAKMGGRVNWKVLLVSWAFTLISVENIVSNPSSMSSTQLMFVFFGTCFISFASCRPPPPPKKRHSTVPKVNF